MKVFSKLTKNQEHLKKLLPADDVIYYNFKSGNQNYLAVYVDSVTDKEQLGELLIRPILALEPNNFNEVFKKLQIANVQRNDDFETLISELLNGKSLLFMDGFQEAIICDFLSFQMRAVSEPPTSTVIKGPREGFNESIKTNLSMLRRRIKVADFAVEFLKIGKYSKNNIAVCYVKSIADKKIVNELKKRLKRINVDSIPDSSYVEKFISENKTSVFRQVGNSEKPDVLTQKLLEGRVGILVDGSPIALSVPYVLLEDFQNPEDYFINNYRANMVRAIRFISILIAIFLPAIFVSAQLFHLQLIPLNFLLTIVNSVKGIPLSPSFEMFFTLLIFEILNEASVRMPKYVGMALSVVGALVLGDTAVKAGIVSTPTIMIMALSGICLYTVPELVHSLSVLRLIFLIVGGSVGGYGIVLAFATLCVFLCSAENFGVPLLAPYAPLITKDLKDGFYMDFVMDMKTRPHLFGSKNKTRLKLEEDKNDG